MVERWSGGVLGSLTAARNLPAKPPTLAGQAGAVPAGRPGVLRPHIAQGLERWSLRKWKVFYYAWKGKMGNLAVNVASMPDLYHIDGTSLIMDGIDDSIVPLSDPIPFLA